MSELARPLKQHLREAPVRVDALWQRIESQRGSRFGAGDLASAWPGRIAFGSTLAGAFVIAALAVLWLVPRTQLDGRAAGPLARANGDVLGVLDASGTQAALEVALSDGSHLYLKPGAKLVPERSDAHQFRASLQSGHVLFDVKPHGPRRWIIDAGDTSVEVLGTRFSVERDSGGVSVSVDRGRVEVRGSRVPQGVQVLGHGDSLVVERPPTAAAPPSRPQTAVVTADQRPARLRPADVSVSDGADASADPSRSSGEGSKVAADERLKHSDAARASGDYRRAARELQLFLTEQPSDPRAAIIALTLGRIQLDKLATPRAAARSLARADRLGLPAAVAEEGAARLVEAYAQSGEKERAREAAASYARRFPDGARSIDVAGWLERLAD